MIKSFGSHERTWLVHTGKIHLLFQKWTPALCGTSCWVLVTKVPVQKHTGVLRGRWASLWQGLRVLPVGWERKGQVEDLIQQRKLHSDRHPKKRKQGELGVEIWNCGRAQEIASCSLSYHPKRLRQSVTKSCIGGLRICNSRSTDSSTKLDVTL